VATAGRVGFAVDPWGPGYAAALAIEALTELDATTAELNLDVEIPADRWQPLTPNPATTLPGALLVADGVRRIDARVWVDDPDGAMPAPGIAASYAVGLVRCALGNGHLAELADVAVRRALFSASPQAPDVATPAGDYPAQPAANSTPDMLSLALQRQLTDLEVTVAARYRAATDADELLLVDGPLRGRTHLPHAVGYVKTHHTAYLSGPHAAVVTALQPGQRTPIFLMGTSWSRHAWYLRLPSRSTVPWAGVARCEASADLSPAQVTTLADVTALLLPPLAGVDYKDPRAPQNLIPIGGLEKLLRHRLGDARLLYRALRVAATHARLS
jgi:hypothetical protein